MKHCKKTLYESAEELNEAWAEFVKELKKQIYKLLDKLKNEKGN